MASDVVGGAALAAKAVALARTRWPSLRCSDDDFREHVETVGAGARELELHGTELCLAAACALGDPGALRVFEADYIAGIEPSLGRFRVGSDFTQEIQQELRCRLLAPPEPRIATYAATGPLLSWVRIAAVRLGLNLKRTVLRRSEELIVDELLCDIQLEHLERSRYIEVLGQAVRVAFAGLPVQERNLLRLHYADGLGLQQLAKLEQVHRATVARRLADARRRIFTLVELEVRARLKLSPSEFGSVLGLVNSYLEASLSGLFAEPRAAP